VLKRDKIAAVGADVEEIGRTLETLLGGRQVTRFKREGQQYDVIVQLKDQDREQPTDLTAIFVRGATDNWCSSRIWSKCGKPLRPRN
jgi:multidrug efflux pump